MPGRKAAPTRKDVARMADVSETIVSYVLNNNRYVSAEKRRRVLEAVEALRYRPNSIARALKGKVIQIKARGGEGGKLYGTVTNEQLAQAHKEQHGVEVDKRRIEPEEPIKSAGQVLCTVRLTAGVSTRMLVNVTVESK